MNSTLNAGNIECMKAPPLLGYRNNRLALFTRSGQRFLRRLQTAWVFFLSASLALPVTLIALIVTPGPLASTAFLVAALSLMVAAATIWFLHSWRPESLESVAEDVW